MPETNWNEPLESSACIVPINDHLSYILGEDDDCSSAELSKKVAISPGHLYCIVIISEHTKLTRFFTLKCNCIELILLFHLSQ